MIKALEEEFNEITASDEAWKKWLQEAKLPENTAQPENIADMTEEIGNKFFSRSPNINEAAFHYLLFQTPLGEPHYQQEEWLELKRRYAKFRAKKKAHSRYGNIYNKLKGYQSRYDKFTESQKRVLAGLARKETKTIKYSVKDAKEAMNREEERTGKQTALSDALFEGGKWAALSSAVVGVGRLLYLAGGEHERRVKSLVERLQKVLRAVVAARKVKFGHED